MGGNMFDMLKNNGIVPGSIVLSKAGHDVHRIYIVISVENKMALLADGLRKNRIHPKKKRVTHLKALGILPDRKSRLHELGHLDSESGQNRLIQEWLLEISTENKIQQKREES